MRFENFLREHKGLVYQAEELSREYFEHLPMEERVDILATFLLDGLTALLNAAQKLYGKLDMDILSKDG